MPVFLLFGAVLLGSGALLAKGQYGGRKLSIEEAARAPTPAMHFDDDEDGEVERGPAGCFKSDGNSVNYESKAHVQRAVQRSELLVGEGCDSNDECSEEELIAGGRPCKMFRRGHSSLIKDTVVAAWLFEERPTPPRGSQVMAMLPASAATHLFIVTESALGWLYVFEKWKDGVSVARFRDPDHARRSRAGFASHYRRRKHTRQLSSVAPPANSPLRVSDLLLWSAEHSEFRQYTDNCHTYAVNLSLHLGMEPPKAVWEQLLYEAY
eukprot:TRINITY_DN33591_c0_g1_i1.p1 TRINITY_DN33591_c0_g1~~TRINITY_DN33591_c0_g1_i1.p1  ORF type:complete len:266 (+),score=51.65 TRINITY_DN33591_c0_g1_i1:245-1042(+)